MHAMWLILLSNGYILFLYLKNESCLCLFLQRNTFQLVLTSTELTTYAILVYPKDDIHYFSTPVGDESRSIEAGFSQGKVGWIWSKQGPYYRMPSNAENSDIRQLTE